MKKNMTLVAVAILILAAVMAVLFTVLKPESTVEPMEETGIVESSEEVAEETTEAEPVETAEEEETVISVPTMDPATLLCTVNGKELTYGDVEPFVASYLDMYTNEYGYDANDPELNAFCNQAGMYMAQQYAILEGIGKEMNVTFTDEQKAQATADATAEWQNVLDYYMSAQYGISDVSTEEEKNTALANTLSMLESMGYTQEAFVNDAIDAAEEQNILDAICKDVVVTDEQVQASVDETIASQVELYGEDVSYYEMMQYYGYPTYYRPEGYRAVTHILLDVDDTLLNNYTELSAVFEEQQSSEEVEVPEGEEPTVTEVPVVTDGATVTAETVPAVTEEPAEPVTTEQVEEARQAILASVQSTIDEIMAKFNAGTSFADLVAEYGTDPGMQQEGMLETGYEVAAGSIMWDLPFRDGAMSIQNVGEVSEPVVGANGVHIIYYLKDIPGGPVTITPDEWESIRNELLDEQKNDAINETISQRMETAEIVYTDDATAYIVDFGEEATEEAAEETAEATEAAPAEVPAE